MASNDYEELLSISRDISYLGSVLKVLDWDQQTNLPSAAVNVRATQRTLLARLSHEMLVSERVGTLLDRLTNSAEVKTRGPVAIANVRELARDHSIQKRIPSRLVEELSRTISLTRDSWLEARTKNQFQFFAPWLEKLVALSREKAQAIGFQDEPYDALLDDYEQGLRAKSFMPVLNSLRESLSNLAKRIAATNKRPDLTILSHKYQADKLASFARQVTTAIGFDFHAGRMDTTTHSFCTGVHPNDVRLATSYNADNPLDSLFATIHEVGHGLYHQGLVVEEWGTPVGRSVSLGVHESQARWWENVVARGRPFWKFFFPKLQAEFPDELRNVKTDDFYGAINHVQPSLIRVEADEVTYNLHVIVRTELERALINGKLQVKDLPAAWDDGTEKIVGIRPTSPRDGVLQDVHWSRAMFGYFPTYTLGNLYAAQLNQRLRKDIPELDTQMARGEFLAALNWMRTRIHRHGAFYPPAELVEKACGEPLTAVALLNYLEEKYRPLYGL